MKVGELPNHRALAPWRLSLRDTPHVTIETNLTCNLRCRACYNLDRTTVKPVSQVLGEIDFALRRRRVDALTLLGGEPTLHPALPQIVRYVAGCGVTPQLLTNGLRFLAADGDAYLGTLARAGLVRVLLHVDEGQRHVHPDLLAVVRRQFACCERHGLFCSLAWTVYPESPGALPRLVRELAPHPRFDGVLALLAQDPDASLRPGAGNARPGLAAEAAALARELGIAPSLFLPSSLDDEDVSWLLYFYYLNAGTGRAFALSPRLCRAYLRLHRALSGRELFARAPSRCAFRVTLALTLALELLRSPRRLAEAARLLRGSSAARRLRFHYLVIQDAPAYDEEKQAVRICHHCPDATVRNGRLLPVCLADRLSPLDGKPRPAAAWAASVLAHMEEP